MQPKNRKVMKRSTSVRHGSLPIPCGTAKRPSPAEKKHNFAFYFVVDAAFYLYLYSLKTSSINIKDNRMENRSLVTLPNIRKRKFSICSNGETIWTTSQPPAAQGKVVATLFFEPSTRTRLSFETRPTGSVHVLSVSLTPKPPARLKGKRWKIPSKW